MLALGDELLARDADAIFFINRGDAHRVGFREKRPRVRARDERDARGEEKHALGKHGGVACGEK